MLLTNGNNDKNSALMNYFIINFILNFYHNFHLNRFMKFVYISNMNKISGAVIFIVINLSIIGY